MSRQMSRLATFAFLVALSFTLSCTNETAQDDRASVSPDIQIVARDENHDESQDNVTESGQRFGNRNKFAFRASGRLRP